MSGKRILMQRALKPRSPRATGLMVLVVLLAFSLFAFNRPRVTTILAPGEVLKAEFSSGYKLVPYESVVKISGVKVGVVTGFERTSTDNTVVEMKLDDGTARKLGTEPSANVRPTLLLGGTYYVELVRGGQDGAVSEDVTIPVDRTSVPVELDKVLTAVTPEASVAAKGTVKSLDETFHNGGRKQMQRLLDNGPQTLGPASEVLRGLQGTKPEEDLANLVAGTQNLAAAMTKREGRLAATIDSLHTTSAALAASRSALSQTVAAGPDTLRVTREGLADLDGTLDQLSTTATSFGPSARALDGLLDELGPVLKQARPVIADARVVARDARPLVEDLVPTAELATGVLNDVKGPVLDRLAGPVTDTVLSPWHGTGKYDGGGNDHTLYQEAGYLFSDTADVFKFHDKNGAHGRLMAGIGLSTPGGILGHSFEQYLEMLGFQLPKGPQEGATEAEAGSPLLPAPAPVPDRSVSGMLQQLLQLPLVSRRTP